MGSQFVDLNGDGHLDYLTATFDGSPHVALGSKEGFHKPVRLKDAAGKRILISFYWDYGRREHLAVGRALDVDDVPKERCISALAFDWDADGDFDLLLGSYENGHLYRMMNEGSNAEPKFTGKNLPVMAGGRHFALPAKMTAPRLVDWDSDGDLDLVVGSFGGHGQKTKGGGVYLSLNLGKKGAPEFGALNALIKPSEKDATKPTRPDIGLYVDAVDYDGDGDLDLVVGGQSVWHPRQRKLTEAESRTVSLLRERRRKAMSVRSHLDKRILEAAQKATEGMDPKSPQARSKAMGIRNAHVDELKQSSKELRDIAKELSGLVATRQRGSFVWLYERL